MGHRFSKTERQPPSVATISPAPPSETAATRASQQQVSAIVITICMLKVAGRTDSSHSNSGPTAPVTHTTTTAMSSTASACGDGKNGSSSCDPQQQLDNCDPRVAGTMHHRIDVDNDVDARAATASSRTAAAVQQPPLISMRDIAGDSSADEADDAAAGAAGTATSRLAVQKRQQLQLLQNAANANCEAPLSASSLQRISVSATNYKRTALTLACNAINNNVAGVAAAAAAGNDCGESVWQQPTSAGGGGANNNTECDAVAAATAATPPPPNSESVGAADSGQRAAAIDTSNTSSSISNRSSSSSSASTIGKCDSARGISHASDICICLMRSRARWDCVRV